MYLGTIWELNIIEMGCRVHTFTSDVGTGASVTICKEKEKYWEDGQFLVFGIEKLHFVLS